MLDDAGEATAPIPGLGPAEPIVDNEGPFAAGALIADGRFRLVAIQGAPGHLQFWQAFDFAAGRMVALTLVDPQESLAVDRVNEVLSLTVRQRGLEHAGDRRGARGVPHGPVRSGGVRLGAGRHAAPGS